MKKSDVLERVRTSRPRIHCLTNPVTMRDVANILLAAGGSAIMARDFREAEEVTALCQGTLLNTGVPDDNLQKACVLAGKKANQLRHPVVLDPVGVGASTLRRQFLKNLLDEVQPDIIRCNQEEASVLCSFRNNTKLTEAHAGVESALHLTDDSLQALASRTAALYHCTVLITGEKDVVSDGNFSCFLTGGDSRIRRITGGGCMLSALCALFVSASVSPYDAAKTAGEIWRATAREAGLRTGTSSGNPGSFHTYLFDALDNEIFERS